MPASLKTGLNPYQPMCWVETGNQDILGFDGINGAVRWNGRDSSTTNVGVPAATDASVAQGAAGSLGAGSYVCYVQFGTADGAVGNLSPGVTVTIAASKKIAWTSIPVSSDSRVTVRYLWRTTAGEASVAYLAGTLADNVTTVFTDDTADATLDDNASINITNADGSIPAEAYARTQPPTHLSAVVAHQGRIYGAVPVPYAAGHLELTNGSTSVTGVGTNFTSAMTGRNLFIKGHSTTYTVTYVSATALTLGATYSGTTNYFAEYTLQADLPERLNVYYSFIGEDAEPESWPATFFFQTQPYGGDVTGLAQLDSFLFIMKQAAIYRFSVADDPAIDGGLFLATGARGCENQRCWVRVEGNAYMLDRQGVHAFSGSSSQPISTQIQDLFRSGAINWSVSKWFHAAYDQESETLMFFVALGSAYLPRHCLAYSLRFGCWAIYEYPTGIGASALIRMLSRRRLALGAEHNRILLSTEGTLDGIAPSTGGTLRGTVSSATLMAITDTRATFPSSLGDVPLVIVSGKGRGQVRRIASVSGQVITLTQPLTRALDSTSVYQIGGIQWKLRTGIMRLTQRNADTTRQVEVTFQPTDTPCQLDIELRLNHSKENSWNGLDKEVGTLYREDGVTMTAGQQSVEVDMYRYRDVEGETEGYARFQFDDNTLVKGNADRFLGVQIGGVSSQSQVSVYQIEIDGVR